MDDIVIKVAVTVTGRRRRAFPSRRQKGDRGGPGVQISYWRVCPLNQSLSAPEKQGQALPRPDGTDRTCRV